MRKFCFICGKETKYLIDGHCRDCYKKKNAKSENLIEVQKCKRCEKLYFENKQVNEEIFLERMKKKFGKDFKIKTNYFICRNCSRESGGYYESILQLRGDFSENIVEFIEEKIREESFCRIEEVKNGFDFYVGSKSVANKVAEILRRKGFEIKKSYKIVTRKDGRDVYRTTILARI